MRFNHADLFEGIADAVGERTALVCGDDRLSYAELDARANQLAHYLAGRGVGPGDHVGMQLYNGVEYVTGLLAALKIRAVPVNVNYRYVEAELEYLYGDADLVALLYDAEFGPRVAAAAPAAPGLRTLLEVGEPGTGGSGGSGGTGGSGEAAGGGRAAERPAGAAGYLDAVGDQPRTRGFPERSPDDRYIIYTGGTTGMPKGVMWRVEDMFFAFGGGNPGGPPVGSPQELVAKALDSGPVVTLPCAPLMHGAAQMATFIAFWYGGTVVLTRRFDAPEVLRAIEREKVLTINIVGDAMARPLAEALAAASYDLSSLFVVSSTGAILSGTVRARLQELLPNVLIMDSFGSTESGYSASGVSGATPETGLRYTAVDPRVAVLGPDLRRVEPGSGEIGQLARSGHISLGYYKDPAKTARTYVQAEGVRWLLTGDLATVAADGTIQVLGRGAACINTGGEKVYVEELEAVLKAYPGVVDAVVAGIPDETYGERVAAVVQTGGSVTAADLDAHCRSRLAGYKVPRTYAFVDTVVRSPAGKADYRWAREVAESARSAGG